MDDSFRNGRETGPGELLIPGNTGNHAGSLATHRRPRPSSRYIPYPFDVRKVSCFPTFSTATPKNLLFFLRKTFHDLYLSPENEVLSRLHDVTFTRRYHQ
jgi:hypothetical protein